MFGNCSDRWYGSVGEARNKPSIYVAAPKLGESLNTEIIMETRVEGHHRLIS